MFPPPRADMALRTGMRVSLVVIGLLVLRASAAGTPAADLLGTARAGDRPQPNAVVWLEAPNAPPGREAKRPVLDQRNLSFSPRVLAVRVGAAVDFPNNDRVFHNVFSFRDGKKFDPRSLSGRRSKAGRVRQARAQSNLLQHSPEHGRLRARRRQPVLRRHGRSRSVCHSAGPCRALHVSRVASGRAGPDRRAHRGRQPARHPLAMNTPGDRRAARAVSVDRLRSGDHH